MAMNPPARTIARAEARPAIAGLRRAHLIAHSHCATGRARIGSPARYRRRSEPRAAALA